MRSWPSAAATIIGVAAAASALRRWQLRWGATAEEAHTALPGDELTADPDLTATRAITVHTAAEAVWPWIVQLGQGRGGFYTYDRLENLLGCDMHSADRVVPEWQDVKVGDQVRLHPEVTVDVAGIQHGHALVLRGVVPMGTAPPPYDFTWAFVLRPRADGTTRLLVRERYGYLRWWTPLIIEPVAVASFVMTERMLRGIRDRAEGGTPTRV